MSRQTQNTEVQVNVVPDSTNGHFITNCKVDVVSDDLGIRLITPTGNGEVALKTENHSVVRVDTKKSFCTFQQMEVDHYRELIQKARD